MSESKVFMFDNSDSEMQSAYQKARDTFRYFWREVAWERRRIVPALDLACVKAPFSDGERSTASGEPECEHMWIDQVDFDGQTISGVLLNAPNWLKTVKVGDPAHLRLEEISDWMYVIQGEVFGAYTVNLMRSRMSKKERAEHDAAWGLKFGDPSNIRLVPEPKSGGIFKSWFGGKMPNLEDHPMSENMVSSLNEQLIKHPKMLHDKDNRGFTLLHQEALAGSAATVKVLLDRGADPHVKTDHGMTPLDLAESLGWENVAALLRGRKSK